MSDKMSIEWHKDCLKNSEIYLQGLIEERDKMNLQIKRIAEDIAFSRLQIEVAIKKGMDGFDNSLFLKKENPRNL